MKKALSVIALLLALMMIVMSFAACDETKDDKEDSSSSAVDETEAPADPNGTVVPAEDAVLAGTYKMIDLEGEGEDFEESKNTFEQLKDYYKLVIEEDNTGVLSFEYETLYEEAHINFDPETNTAVFVEENNSVADYTFDGTTLRITMVNNITQVYEKL